jgi:hypothetical protein
VKSTTVFTAVSKYKKGAKHMSKERGENLHQ